MRLVSGGGRARSTAGPVVDGNDHDKLGISSDGSRVGSGHGLPSTPILYQRPKLAR